MAKKADKFCLLDTNILVYALNADSEHHRAVRGRLEKLQKERYRFCITEQIVRETLVVLTQPRFLAHPLDAVRAKRLGAQLLHQFVFLPSNNYSRLCLLDLIATYELVGNQIHDANIVAVMQAHGVRELLTYNKKDFQRLREIVLLPLG